MRNCITLLICLSLLQNSKAQLNDAKYFNSMQWRMIGPHRGGRTVGAVGVPSQPNVFYIGVNNGGVWKTNDFGRTWKPIFDGQPTGSVGDVVVAPSNPDVIMLVVVKVFSGPIFLWVMVFINQPMEEKHG